MQQRPDLIIEMTPQSLGEAGSAESAAVSAECSARGSEWRAHEAAWRHSFAKMWRFEGHQFTKHHAPSLYTINRPEKFRFRFPGSQGISYPLEVWPCFMYHHILSAVSSSCSSYVEANSDIAEMENSGRHWFSDHLGDGKVMTWRHRKFREPIYVHNT